ncbi:neuronal pentraxin receptor [Silurus meridionalis]|nr:neuronal pentraxin receptor [Silurus meridionalis]
MKFVAVVAGAGALAFLGALVCIVASVYSRAPAAASPQSPASTNGTVSPLPPGSLGALYGADTSQQEPAAGAGLETPLLGELSAGASPQRFVFSRLLCSPVPPGECAMRRRRRDKEREQQAEGDDQDEDEDWGALSATAEELRRTVALQSEQIAADRRTIDELTGKLAECESALLDERSVAERGAAASVPARRRLMAGDGVRESAAAQLHTARAVEELERAILQLKDRIEKLELEMVPALLNHSEVAAGSTGMRLALGQSGGRVEDVGGELVQKVKHLEEERKNLRKETQNHNHRIDQGINTLQERISELEQSFTGQSYPQGFKLSFPMRTNYMYGLLRRNIPEMYAFTACVWLKATESGIGTPFSYAVDKQPNELVLLQGVHKPAELLINAKVAQLPLSFPPGTWQHVCVSWTLRDGVWKAYQGGKLKGRGEGLSSWHPIRSAGVLVLGQEQDMPGGQFDASQALVGELSLFNLWDRVLSPAEIGTLAACGEPALMGNVVSWTDRDVDVFGGATKEPVDPCTSDATAQK